jgi:F-type H+-transporting ATPase subunit epsilon
VGASVPFKLITPVDVKFDGEAELVIAVGTEGETGILPHHAPYLTTVRPGLLRANVIDGDHTKRLELATGEGFLQVLPDRVTLLVDAALSGKEVDIDKARHELREAHERQAAAVGDLEAHRREQYAIDFATAKLHVAGVLH